VGSAGGEKGTRRRSKRRAGPATPGELGSILQRARTDRGLGLSEVHDRTGISWAQLEALEEGDLLRFPDERSAVAAVRRCADLVGLDPEELTPVVREHWQSGLVGATAAPGVVGWAAPGSAAGAVPTGHLTRYPGDRTNLEAFTQTAQTRRVRRADGSFDGSAEMLTGAYPAVPPLRIRPVRRRSPLVLRIALWLTLLLIAVGVAGLVIHHVRPQWLKDIHLVPGLPTAATVPPHTTIPPTAAPSLTTLTPSGSNAAVMSVRAPNYTVVAQAVRPADIEVTTPASFSPLFSGVVPAGARRSFPSADGRVTIQFSGAQILVAVEVNGTTVPASLFKPAVIPFTLNFSSTP
jgi:cytoskeletal protein RodZ